MFEVLAPDLALAAVFLGLGLWATRKRRAGGAVYRRAEVLTGTGLVGAAILVSLLGLVGPAWIGVPVAVIIGLGWAIWFSLPVDGAGLGLVCTAVVSAAVVYGYGNFVNDWSRSVEPGKVVEIVPQRADGVDGRTLTYFQSARCLPELAGSYSVTKDGIQVASTVAPLVHQSWSPSQPVPAWIGLGELPAYGMTPQEACAPEGGLGAIAALRIPRAGHIARAVDNALKRHELTETDTAPTFRFAPTKRKVIQRVWLGRGFAGALIVLWGLALAGQLYDSIKLRSTRTKESP
jgi:hypothetical protein